MLYFMIKKLYKVFLLLLMTCTINAKEIDNLSYHERSALNMIEHIQSQVISNGNILDLGCGKGAVTKYIADYFSQASVTGLDLSPQSIEDAQEKYPVETSPNLKFQQGDAEHFSSGPAFDLVMSISLLHLVDHPQQVLKEVYDSLKPNGVMVMQVPKDFAKPLIKANEDMLASERWSLYFENYRLGWKFLTPQEYERELKNLGFNVIRVIVFEESHHFSSPEELKKFIGQWHPYLERIPNDLKDIFLEEMTQQYLSYQPVDSLGGVPFVVERIEMEAQKII